MTNMTMPKVNPFSSNSVPITYENGTFDPEIRLYGGDATVAEMQAYYERIGNVVHVLVYAYVHNLTGSTQGGISLTPPFTTKFFSSYAPRLKFVVYDCPDAILNTSANRIDIPYQLSAGATKSFLLDFSYICTEE